MFELLFLGTGAGMPSSYRNTTSTALILLENKNEVWLFDCGEATQHQILQTKIRPRNITKIFISHMHGDHIFGLPGLLSSRCFLGGEKRLEIYGPPGLKKFVNETLKLSYTHIRYPLSIYEISEGVILTNEQFIISAVGLAHVAPTFGYRIVQRDQAGPLNVKKLKEFGLEPGPLYGEIKKRKFVNIGNGNLINSAKFTSEARKGKIIAISGDTAMCESVKKLAENADWLVHEATFSVEHEQRAHAYSHSTNVEVANMAKDCNVKNLILTHISPRYSPQDYEKLLLEVEGIIPNIYLAEDFLEFKL